MLYNALSQMAARSLAPGKYADWQLRDGVDPVFERKKIRRSAKPLTLALAEALGEDPQ